MNHLRSTKVQLIATAVAASITTASVIYAYDSYSKRERRKKLDWEIRHSIAAHNDIHELPRPVEQDGIESEGRANNYEYDEDLIREQLARNYVFFGERGCQKSEARRWLLLVVGVMLVRSGVSKIRLVDFDYVTLSSLNRHATATSNDVGTPKVTCIEKTLKEISRWVEVDSRIDIWRKEEGGMLLEGADWVIGSRKVFSSMGASAKCDPTRIQISDISYTIYDPLARSVRRRLRLLGVPSGIPVVYSTEVPGDVKLLPLPEEEFQKGPVKELGVYDDFRVRILPVLGPLPSIFGLYITTYILCEMAGKPILNPLPIKNRKKLYERLLRDLLQREIKSTGQLINKLPIDEDDVALILEDLHRGRSVIPPFNVPARPVLVRWNIAEPLTVENCVVMEHGEAQKHTEASQTSEGKYVHPRDIWGTEAQEVVERRASEFQTIRQWVM
ncbi:ubiquitin-protein ligase molybdopterin-converting factor [Infundibulicybe gibba]|nr:ubiquitin-protein ligase molybdopterin-converting factor [Infundibulicybe gibba]